jgi:Holliday junction resolvase RusA-like endonuclease
MDVNNDDVMIINLIDDDDEEGEDEPTVHPRDRMVHAFNPAVYSFLRDDLLAHTAGHKIHFIIRGRPVVLKRTRHYNGAVVNPSAARIAQLRGAIQGALERPNVGATAAIPAPMFNEMDRLSVTLVLRMPRPLTDFVGRNRLTGARIGRNLFSSALGDVDNFAKLVLDAMNGVMFVDDRQVVMLRVIKTSDNVGMSNGSTEILVRKVRARDMVLALSNIA